MFDLKQYQNTIEEVEREIKQLQAVKRELYEQYKEGSVDKAVYFKERETVDNTIKEKAAERESLIYRNNSQAEELTAANHFLDSFAKLYANKEPNAEVANALVESVSVYAKDRIEIKFTFADKLEKSLHVLNQRL